MNKDLKFVLNVALKCKYGTKNHKEAWINFYKLKKIIENEKP